VFCDILLALDRGDFAALGPTCLWHSTLSTIPAYSASYTDLLYGICGSALSCVRSYLSDRSQFVRSGTTSSRPTTLRCGVSRGSVLGPILFLLYRADLWLSSNGLQSLHPIYSPTSDPQVYGYCAPTDVDALHSQLSTCVSDIGEWMAGVFSRTALTRPRPKVFEAKAKVKAKAKAKSLKVKVKTSELWAHVCCKLIYVQSQF